MDAWVNRFIPRWAEFRADVLRRDLLTSMTADLRGARDEAAATLLAATTPAARAAAMGALFGSALAVGHLEGLAKHRPDPLVLELRVACGELEADRAVDELALDDATSLGVFTRLAPACGQEALAQSLTRVRWGGYVAARTSDLLPALRRAVALGLGGLVVGLLRVGAEPERSELLAALLEHLSGPPRGDALELLARRLVRLRDPLERLSLALALRPHLQPQEWSTLQRRRRDLPVDLGPASARAELTPHFTAAWARAATQDHDETRLDALERCMSLLGSLATPDEAERWLDVVLAACTRGVHCLYRLQTGIGEAHLDAAARRICEQLPPVQACEALVWIARGQGGRATELALEALRSHDLPESQRADHQVLLLERLDGPGRAAAAREVLALPGRTRTHELRALCYLDDAEHRARARALLRDPMFAGGSIAFTSPCAVPFLAGLARNLDGDDREAVLAMARRHLVTQPARLRATQVLALAPALPREERLRQVHETLAQGGVPPSQRSSLVALLPEDQRDGALAGPIQSALTDPVGDERWHTLEQLALGLPDERNRELLRAIYRRGRASGQVAAEEIASVPEWVLDAELVRERIAHELSHPGLYIAWNLGRLARELPEAERGPVLDRAIAEFARISLAPTSPGNDAGPFVELADLLDEAQVRRALAVTLRMSAAPWGSDLDTSRQHLHLRLAALGQLDEAEAALRTSGRPRDLAWSLGALLGIRLRRGESWSTALHHLQRGLPESDAETRFEALTGALWALDAESMREDIVEGLVAQLPAIQDPNLRSDALAHLFNRLRDAVPPARWYSLIREHAVRGVRVELRLELADAIQARAPELATTLVREVVQLADVDPEIGVDDILVPLCRRSELLLPEELARLLARWLTCPGNRRQPLLDRCCDAEVAEALPPALYRLGGAPTVRAVATALDSLESLLR